jgi:hypothetical protein
LLLAILVAGGFFFLRTLPAGAQTPTPNGPQIRFMAPVRADGCPFCCEFSCRLTPTPTPEFDAEGRQVFTRSDATFILAVEATSGAGAEGSVLVNATTGGRVLQPITNLTGRPSLQLLVSRALGNGSTQKCDIFPPNSGGVPGINPPDFNSSTQTTDALIDMACRFEVLSSQIACTRNMFGDYAFLGGTTSVRQYCYTVPASAAFGLGTTIVSAQVRGTNGNLGPKKEIVIRVGAPSNASPSPTPTRTPTRTSTPSNNSVAGRVRYYSADRSVGNATVQASGPAFNQTSTNTSGNYSFASLVSGNWHIEPRKTTDFASAISSLDAAWIFQSQVGLRTLTSQQRLAADVTGNGTVSSLDGARIVQYRVGSLVPPRFAVSTTCQSDWAFIPMPSAAQNQTLIQPLMSTGSCRLGAIDLKPIVGQASGQDFHAVAFGDVTGNWMPPGGTFAARRGAQPTVQFGRLRRAGPHRLRLPVLVRSRDPYASFELEVAYDTSRLRATGVKRARAAGRMFMRGNTEVAGLVKVAAAGPDLIAGRAGPLLYVEFHTLSDLARDARVQLLGAAVDDVPAVAMTER